MKTIVILFTLTALVHSEDSGRQLIGSWTLVCYEQLLSDKIECEPAASQKHPIKIDFEKGGKIAGNTSGNTIRADYSVLGDHKIKIQNFEGTKRGEFTKWGTDFRKIIGLSSSFAFKGDTLILLYDNDKKAMKFVKE